ncbi:alpha/beta fold hydrolase [Primorskyibacter marinus]|uniref:alpha/beta fold hydrolase n=1 Tax=Primorskyibacter marinus TaxID=1977320 RepID=UPI0018E4EC23|nr:alpha/beta hydrolase [Primorskyibacter marinus]
MARTEERIFNGGHIRASLFNPDAARLIVTFRQRVADPGTFSEARPVHSFIRHNHAHLHLQSQHNDWYINADTLALADVLRDVTARYRRVSAIGFSMGGYAALRFSKPLRLRQLVAVSPQFTISPRVLPGDARYRDCAGGFDDALGSLDATARRGLQGVILCDPFKRLDVVNAEMIQTVFPNLHICRLGGGGHPASRVLRQGGHFGDLQKLLLSGEVDPARVIALHRTSRRESDHYWAHIAKVAARRQRPELAEFAAERAARLIAVAQAGRNPPDAS